MDKLKTFSRTPSFQIRFTDIYCKTKVTFSKISNQWVFFKKNNLVKQRRLLETQRHE